MSVRLLFSLMVAMALAFAPFAMPMGEASAAPGGHHEGVAKASSTAGHCDDMPAPAKSDSHQKKPCCTAGCMAAAMLPAAGEGLALAPLSRERPGLDQFQRGFLVEIATPPPRLA